MSRDMENLMDQSKNNIDMKGHSVHNFPPNKDAAPKTYDFLKLKNKNKKIKK